ncbi:FAD-binding oxidoreductase [Nakamurella alba]|nr:FAD-binding protein [Nakamurella alba]
MTELAAPPVHDPRELLRRGVKGPVLTVGDADFADELATFDPLVVHRPDVVVGATDAIDVVAALDWAARHDLRWGVLGAGHAEVPEHRGGLVVTTRRMDGVEVDPVRRIARVQAGARWEQVLAAADRHGLMPVCGAAPGVGVVGLLTGGGVGPLARSYGVCSDRVRSAELVRPGHGVMRIDPQHRPDLLGAVFGGRIDVGIVTSVEIELVVQEGISGGGMYFAEADIPAVVDAFRRWTKDGVADGVTTSLAVLRLPDLPGVPAPLAGRTVAHLRVAATGAAAGSDPLPPAVRRAAAPVLGGVGPLPATRIGCIHADPEHPVPHVGGGLLLDEFTGDTAAAWLDAVGPDSGAAVTIAEIRHWGDALAITPEDRPDCVPGRDSSFGVWVSAPPAGPDLERPRSSVRRVLDAVRSWGRGGATVNFSGSANTRDEVEHGWDSRQQ